MAGQTKAAGTATGESAQLSASVAIESLLPEDGEASVLE
jgi:hypothetical protein